MMALLNVSLSRNGDSVSELAINQLKLVAPSFGKIASIQQVPLLILNHPLGHSTLKSRFVTGNSWTR